MQRRKSKVNPSQAAFDSETEVYRQKVGNLRPAGRISPANKKHPDRKLFVNFENFAANKITGNCAAAEA